MSSSSLTITEQALVLESFVDAVEAYSKLTTVFYAHLFRLDPQLQALFPENMVDQERKLMRALAKLIHLVGEPQDFQREIRKIVQRHRTYNVKPIDYLTFGDAFISTLEEVLGDRFTPEVRSAWNTVFRMVGETVLDEAYLVAGWS